MRAPEEFQQQQQACGLFRKTLDYTFLRAFLMMLSLETAKQAFDVTQTGDSLSRFYLISASSTLSLMCEFMLRVALERPESTRRDKIKLNSAFTAMNAGFALPMSQTVFGIEVGVAQRFFSAVLSSLPAAVWDILRKPAVAADVEMGLLAPADPEIAPAQPALV